MIYFKTLELEGFGCIQKRYKYTLGHKGITIIRGANGKGKTTLFNGLVWVLTGKSLKKKNTIETWPELQGKDFRGTQVILTLKVEGIIYTILRHKKFKGSVGAHKGGDELIIRKDGKDIPFEDKRDSQKFIYDLLGCSYETFIHGVVFGQKMKRFIEEDGPDKKKVFEEIFDTIWIEKANQKAKEDLEELEITLKASKDKYKQLLSSYMEVKGGRSKELSVLKEIKKRRDARLKEFELDIVRIESDLKLKSPKPPKNTSQINQELKELQDLIEAKSQKLSSEKLPIELKLQALKGEIKDYGIEIIETKKRYKKYLQRVCPECGSKLKGPNVSKTIGELKLRLEEVKKSKISAGLAYDQQNELLRDLNRGEEEIRTLRGKYLALRSRESTNIELAKAYEVYERRIALSKQKLGLLTSQMEESKEAWRIQIANQKERLSNLKAKRVLLKAKKKEVRAEIAGLEIQLDTLSWIKSIFSNSGLKAFIFNEACGAINAKLATYCENMAFKIEIGVDVETHNKDFYAILTHKGVPRIYNDLSGGEQQLVSVFIAFAINDVLGETLKKNNLLLLDEVFESLSLDNIEMVQEFITEKAKGKCIHLITHSDAIYPSNSRVMEMDFKI